MPGRRYPRAKWVLPEVIDPPDHICITIPVPNDRQHIAAFWGALYNLTSGIFWADDTAHTARLVAKVWQEIYDALVPDSCAVEPVFSIDEWEDELSICESLRFQDGKLQGLCCGEWVDIAGQGDSSLGTTGQPGGGADQPTAGGAPVCYHGNQVAAYQWLAPTVVSDGDTIEFSNLSQAAWDGVAPVPLPGRWDCPDGKLFFAGQCQDGTESLDPSDPLPTAPHMSLICQIAGVWYSALSTITVPGGVSNAQVTVQLNDSAIGDNQGQYAFDMCVTKAAGAPTFEHTWDFTLSPGGWYLQTYGAPGFAGQWVAGVGWVHTDNLTAGLNVRGVNILHHVTGAHNITYAEIHFSFTQGTYDSLPQAAETFYPGATALISKSTPSLVTGANQTVIGSGVILATDPMQIYFYSADTAGAPNGAVTITKVIVRGTGADPF